MDKEEAVEWATNGEDGDCDEHTDCIRSFVVIKAERSIAGFSFSLRSKYVRA